VRTCLYQGRVRHRRESPAVHDFSYSVYMACLDLDELPQALRGRWLWSAERLAPLRFRRSDHFGDPGEPLAESVRRLVGERTGRRPQGGVLLLTNLRHFGHVFNPLSLFYCLDPTGESIEAVVAEVSNTPWHERHLYVLDAIGRAPENGWYVFDQAKEFYVSPFMAMDAMYRFRLTLPGETLGVQIDSAGADGRFFTASMGLRRRPASGAGLVRVLARFPLMTLKVVGAIHFEALRLWIKRVPVFPHPGRPL
jgi:DUF1365 family protein